MKKEYVEIGGIKWATMNVGAEKETDFGLYFQCGAEQGYSHPTNLCKFEIKPRNFCDSVQAYWGGNWRTPTSAEFESLLINTTNEWKTDYQGSGVNGMLFTDKTDSSKTLFFPACGYCVDDSVRRVGVYGYYWSRSLSNYNVLYAWGLCLCDNYVGTYCYSHRYGYGVRGVLADK